MVDLDLIITKAGLVQKHLLRVKQKRGKDLKSFLSDLDCQDIVAFNLQTAIQNCIDIAAHIIADEGLGVPGSVNEMLYLLEENEYITTKTTEKMVRAVGFRNLMVHEYGKIDLERVYKIAYEDIEDLIGYLSEVFYKLGIQK